MGKKQGRMGYFMSIAMKPLGQPPFPIERIEEMTGMMGGEGSLQQSRQ